MNVSNWHDRDEIVAEVRSELSAIWPETAGVQLLQARVVTPAGSEDAGTFRFYRDDHVVAADGEQADFVRADDGTLFGVRIGGRVLVRQP